MKPGRKDVPGCPETGREIDSADILSGNDLIRELEDYPFVEWKLNSIPYCTYHQPGLAEKVG